MTAARQETTANYLDEIFNSLDELEKETQKAKEALYRCELTREDTHKLTALASHVSYAVGYLNALEDFAEDTVCENCITCDARVYDNPEDELCDKCRKEEVPS